MHIHHTINERAGQGGYWTAFRADAGGFKGRITVRNPRSVSGWSTWTSIAMPSFRNAMEWARTSFRLMQANGDALAAQIAGRMIEARADSIQPGDCIAGDTIRWVHDVGSNSLGDVILRCAYSQDGYPSMSLILPPDEMILARSGSR